MNDYLITSVLNEADFIQRLPKLERAELTVYPWDSVPHHEAYAVVAASPTGLHVFMRSDETEIRAKQTEQNGPIYTDSCLEFYLMPCPQSVAYFNIEVSPKGIIYFSVGKERAGRLLIVEESPLDLGMKAEIHPVQYEKTGWCIRYHLPFSLIQKYIPEFHETERLSMRGNFYKCGNGLSQPHWGMWSRVDTEKPDFHRPEFFGRLTLQSI